MPLSTSNPSSNRYTIDGELQRSIMRLRSSASAKLRFLYLAHSVQWAMFQLHSNYPITLGSMLNKIVVLYYTTIHYKYFVACKQNFKFSDERQMRKLCYLANMRIQKVLREIKENVYFAHQNDNTGVPHQPISAKTFSCLTCSKYCYSCMA